MTGTPFRTSTGRTIESLLAERGTLAVPQAVEFVRKLAEQVAALHVVGRLHLAITAEAVAVDDELRPALTVSDAGSAVPQDLSAWAELLPELQRLLPSELPAEMEAARARLRMAGIALDPRQIDLCQLGALFCRVLTGESATAYLRSARVKGRVPAELQSILEQALGCDGQKRFFDSGDFLAALNAVMNQPTALVERALLEAPSAPGSDVELGSPSRPTGNTTPSFVAPVDKPADTSVGPAQPSAAQSPAAAPHKSDCTLPFSRLGHYEIVARIGHGGMGDVYRGYERALDREVAIKVLPAELARSDDFVRRFRAEATAAAKLIHPNIIQMFFFGEDAGHHFFGMQYVEGESLADLLARQKKLPVTETLAIVEQALAGLAAAHSQGMVHRDIKPGNILLDSRNRRALLADFGLVKSLENSATDHTATGVVMGTVDYISPEQGRGQTVDGRSDLYSTGVLLYHLLAGRLPFEADNPTALIFQHVYEPPPPLAKTAPHVPAPLATMIEKLLAKSPDDRYQTAEEVLIDLRAFRTGQPLSLQAQPPEESRLQSTMVRLSDFDEEEPRLLVGLTDVAPSGWWQGPRDWAVSLFQKHAPDVLQQWQNTQQQMGGAVVEYERRCRDLQQLAHDAESVLTGLQNEAAAQRAAARGAAARAEAARSTADEAQARTEQAAAERTTADLDRQIAEQHEQMESIRLRLAQQQARRHELRNQQDILNARLRAAQAGFAGERARPARPRWIWLIVGGVAVGLLVFVILVMSRPKGDLQLVKDVPVGEGHPPSDPSAVSDAVPDGPTAFAPRPAASTTITGQDVAVDPAHVMPGLLVTEYPRQPTQDSGEGGFVPLEKLGDPVGTPSVIHSLTKWKVNHKRNVMAEGLLQIDVAGEYRFLTSSFYDLNALYVNGLAVCEFRDGEKTESKVDLKPGFVPIASVGYALGRDIVDVWWAPPGQPEMSAIPADRLSYPADLKAKRAAEFESADLRRQRQFPPTLPVDAGDFQPGLTELRFARLSSQVNREDSPNIVPPSELGSPLGEPRLVSDISPSTYNPEENVIVFGYLSVERAGEYAFYCNSDFNRGKLFVNGQILYKTGDAQETVYRIRLNRGLVHILLAGYFDRRRISVECQPPGQLELGAIPRDALWHEPYREWSAATFAPARDAVPIGRFDEYRARIEKAWKGRGERLTRDFSGRIMLHLNGCSEVKDLAPLKGMLLDEIRLNHCDGVVDLTPLAGMPLKDITFNPTRIQRGLDTLRAMKGLETIGLDRQKMESPADFWTHNDAGEFQEAR